MKFKCKLIFLIIISFLFGFIFYRVRYVKSILEKNPEIELGIEINLPKIRRITSGHAIRNGHFNASEFINNEKEHTNSLRFSSGKPTLSKLKVFEKYELSQWEKDEINILDGIWFIGNASIERSQQASNETDFDGEKGRYKWKLGNHINHRYEIIKYLGGGTYGEVLKAFDHKFDTEVAIKILNNGHSESRTNAEFETIQHINHHFPKSAFFVRNIENFRFRTHFCMIFELLGDPAYELYDSKKTKEKRPFRDRENQLKDYIADILKGLILLHSIGVVHNDLKPENLLLDNTKYGDDLHERPRIKIMDFGLSCILSNQENSKNSTKCENYHVQTRYYRSPEVMLGIPYDQSSDMWQLGVIAAEMFRGKRFIISESDADHLAATMEIIGLPPLSVLQASSKRQVYYDAICYETEKGFKRQPYRKSIQATLNLEFPKHDKFHDFLSNLLQWKSSKRMTAVEAINHPWITEN